jgi:endonuclease YncB( thermonuclease family)
MASPPEDTLVKATVSRVRDADTIDVREMEAGIRLIGIDAPERGEPCYDEGKRALEGLVLGKSVYLEKDVTDKDVYGRLLRYVYMDSIFVNEELARQGYAFVYAYGRWKDNKHYEKLEKAANEAAVEKRGVYSRPPEEFKRIRDRPGDYYLPLSYIEGPKAEAKVLPVEPLKVQVTGVLYDSIVPRVESDKYVEIKNLGKEPQGISGWKLLDVSDGEPEFSFAIAPWQYHSCLHE